MVLDVGNLFERGLFQEYEKSFIVAIEQGGIRVTYPQGYSDTWGEIPAVMSALGVAAEETQKTRGYKLTWKVFNGTGVNQTYTYIFSSAGTTLETGSTGVMTNDSQFTKTIFVEPDKIIPGSTIQFGIVATTGSLLGTDDTNKYHGFWEVKCETIQERRNGIN